jgi:RHS repeat-associated protein
MAVNGTLSGASTGTTNFTAYISPYLVVNNGGLYTKHVYVGSQRIMSKLASSDIFNVNPTDASVSKATYTGNTLNFATKYNTLTATVKARYDSLGVVYNGVPQSSANLITATSAKISTPQQYFYHSDHLGSANYITDSNGDVSQHLEFIASGEVFVDERFKNWHTPFAFNGKEQDEETGLIYFGKRYLDPHTGAWTASDELKHLYPNVSSYVNCLSNPLKYKDPDGRVVIPVHGTWSNNRTWKDTKGLVNVCFNLFGDNKLGKPFSWTGGNYSQMRNDAASKLVNVVRERIANEGNSEPITLVGHSHGGNVSIEAINMMVKMDEFKDVKFNLLTINTPVRNDYQLSEEALIRTTHVNVYDPKDPVQSNGGNSLIILPDNQSNVKGTGEYGNAGRTFNNAKNIEVENSQGLINGWNVDGGIQWGDYHNSHNRINDWINKTIKK